MVEAGLSSDVHAEANVDLLYDYFINLFRLIKWTRNRMKKKKNAIANSKTDCFEGFNASIRGRT